MQRQYYKKLPNQNLLYFYSITFPRVSNRPLIRPVQTPIYYDVKRFFEQELADKGKLSHFGIEPGMTCTVKRIDGKEMNTKDLNNPALVAQLRQLESDFNALDRELPQDSASLEAFFEKEEETRDKRIESALMGRPLVEMTEGEFFKICVEEMYSGLAKTFHKDWLRITKSKREIGLKEREL